MSHAPSDEERGPQPANESRLESWKQIATYLEREVRTAQRWEKSEGLPVHRHRHAQRDTVFALPSELDAWLAERTHGAGSAARPATPADAHAPAAPRRVPARALLGLTLAALACLGLLRWPAIGGKSAPAPERILVLPVQSLGYDVYEQSVCRALHEDLISGISRAAPQRLAVLGRTSAMRFAGSGIELAQLQDELEVGHLLEASVRRRGPTLRVTARLVDTADQSEAWSAAYELDLETLAAEEGRVAGAIRDAVVGELCGLEPSPEDRYANLGPQAREAWMSGRYLMHKGTADGFRASVEQFEKACALAPEFAGAHAALAQSLTMLGRYGLAPAREVFPRARAAADRALELDPGDADAHTALALVAYYHDWNFQAAAASFREALRLGPTSAWTHHAWAHYLSCLGLHGPARRAAERARELDPLWSTIAVDTAWLHHRARAWEQAVSECRRALALEPGLAAAVHCLSESLRRAGDDEAAWEALRTHGALDALGEELAELDAMPAAQALVERRRRRRAELERRGPEPPLAHHTQVFSLAGLEREDELLDALEAALADRDRVLLLTLVHPAFDSLREHPRMRAIVDAVGFPTDPSGLVDSAHGPSHALR